MHLYQEAKRGQLQVCQLGWQVLGCHASRPSPAGCGLLFATCAANCKSCLWEEQRYEAVLMQSKEQYEAVLMQGFPLYFSSPTVRWPLHGQLLDIEVIEVLQDAFEGDS